MLDSLEIYNKLQYHMFSHIDGLSTKNCLNIFHDFYSLKSNMLGQYIYK